MIELIEILNATKGKNEKNEPQGGVCVSEQLMDAADNMKTIKEYAFTSPVIDIILNGDYIIFDLTFPKTSAGEMRVLWNYLEGFGKNQNKHFEGLDTPILDFVIVPIKYSGQYFYTLVNPIYWAMQPSMPGSQIDTIRMLFEKEALNFFEADAIDEREIENEIEKEEYELQRLEEIENRKEAEHEEYLKKLDEKFNTRN